MRKIIIMIVTVMVIISGILVVSGANTKQEPKKPEKKMELSYSDQSYTGYCGNPAMDGADPSTVNEQFNIPDNYKVAAVLFYFTWTDDHYGEDAGDTYDTFELAVTGGNNTESIQNNEGELIICVGTENINLNAKSENDVIKQDFKPLSNIWDIAITISECGSYPAFRPNGRLRYYDSGNDWNLDVQALVVEYT